MFTFIREYHFCYIIQTKQTFRKSYQNFARHGSRREPPLSSTQPLGKRSAKQIAKVLFSFFKRELVQIRCGGGLTPVLPGSS
jgi:hypothetical protein